jgi:hypothetical protein
VKDVLAKMLVPAVFGVAAAAPFAVLEGVNRRGFPEGFPAVLFGLLWLLSATFVFVLRPIVRDAREGHAILARPGSLALRLAALTALACLWGAIVMDQMPCFLGVPNCD